MDKYKVGDVVNAILYIAEIDDEDERLPYRLQNATGERYIWVDESDFSTATPAPRDHEYAGYAPSDWMPKKGDRVLIECNGTVIDVNPSIMPVSALIEFKHGNAEWFLVNRTLPAPAQSKFAVGEVVVYRPLACDGIVVVDRGENCGARWYDIHASQTVITAKEDELISRDEAVKLLAK